MFLEADLDSLDAVSRVLDASPAQAEAALARALNRTVAGVKARFGPELAAEAGLKVSQFQRYRTAQRKASRKAPRAKFWVGLNQISLGHYGNAQTVTGVTTTAGRGNKTHIPHAFVPSLGGRNVFVNRKWLGELPAGIVQSDKQFSGMRKAVRLAYDWDGAATADRILGAAMRYAEARLLTEFEHELRRETGRV